MIGANRWRPRNLSRTFSVEIKKSVTQSRLGALHVRGLVPERVAKASQPGRVKIEAIMRINVWVAISFTILGASVHTFASQATPDPDRIQRGLLRDIPPSSIEELAKGAEVVLRARLMKT